MTTTPPDDVAPPDQPEEQAPGNGASSIDEVLAKLRATPPDKDLSDALSQAEQVLNEAGQQAYLERLVSERTDDLQRLQAEYANYRKRVERDRALARQQGGESVVRELLPIWDAIASAASHEELVGGFKVVAGEFTHLAEKLGLTAFGAVGDEFDPQLHDALMQIPTAEVEPGHLAQVIQQGYRLGDTVLRPARVAVAAAPAE